ncbi:MAG: bifunctional hydroxymethylpyrimidine kinase/phosphomethylpyrimidine kinase [Deltaproteobacteria bacterium]|nr:bifunctional hydroxymethylpyrimidine kinase/phosphomethylpyrimidine kinase [Deltaproteobacteria bacterium]
MKTVLIIAGSDPGAGAGLQQDLKAATLLGAYGLTVVTALTVQNSQGVKAVHPVAPEVVAAQLDAVLSDFPVAAVKVGMLATPALVRTVAERLKGLDAPLVLDPVLAAGGGFPLLTAAGIERLTEELFPLAYLITPNAPEAARLAGLEVKTPEDLEKAARRLKDMGPRWVLAKGGHLPGEPVDVLTDGKNVYHLPGVRLVAPNHHGSGCLLASACAAGLAQGLSAPETVNRARELTAQALKYGLSLGRGAGPVNPYAPFARDLARLEVLAALQTAAARLEKEGIEPLIPEVMSNLGYATPYPEGPRDVAAFPGRLRRGPQGLLIPAPPAFGASSHISAIILTAMTTHPELRSAMNVKFFEGVDDLAPLLHLRVASFDRNAEPPEVKAREGGALTWGVASVLKPGEPPPDLIYDRGEFGKEPMIRILGPTPMSVAAKALALKNALQAAGKL